MVFKANIPQPNDDLDNTSQPDLLGNMQQLDASFGTDHFAFSDLTVQNGIHKQVRLADQAAPGASPGDGVLFSAISDGNSWPHWQNAAGIQILSGSATLGITNGYASLPGGLLIQWGVSTANTVTQAVLFNTPFTLFGAPSTAFSVVITPNTSSITNNQAFTVIGASISSTGFTIGSLGYTLPANFTWIAIGNKS